MTVTAMFEVRSVTVAGEPQPDTFDVTFAGQYVGTVDSYLPGRWRWTRYRIKSRRDWDTREPAIEALLRTRAAQVITAAPPATFTWRDVDQPYDYGRDLDGRPKRGRP
jgi:hypothetical protein